LASGPWVAPLEPAGPIGSLAWRSSTTEQITPAGESDEYTIELVAGQQITFVVRPSDVLEPVAELRDADGALVASAAAAAGQEAVIHSTPIGAAGVYTLAIAGAGGSTGGYLAELWLDASLEHEAHAGPGNDVPLAAEDLDATFTPLGLTGGMRTVLAGRLVAGDTDWYRLTLADGQSVSLLSAGQLAAPYIPGGAVVSAYNAEGELLATSAATASGQHIGPLADALDGADEQIFVRVAGGEGDYVLVVGRDAAFDVEGNDQPNHRAVELPASGVAFGAILPPDGRDAGGSPLPGPTEVPGAPLSIDVASDGTLGGVDDAGLPLLPAAGPRSSYSVSIGGTTWTNVGSPGPGAFPVALVDRSSADRHEIAVLGQLAPGVRFERTIAWRDGERFAIVTMTLVNDSSEPLTDVRLAESLLPAPGDQSLTFGDVHPDDAAAIASNTSGALGLASLDGRAVASIEPALVIQPSDVLDSPEDPDGAPAEAALAVAFELGDLQPGRRASAAVAVLVGADQADVLRLYAQAGRASVAADAPVTFAMIGDYGANTTAERQVATMIAGTNWNADFLVTGGDNNYSQIQAGPSGEWETRVGDYYGPWIRARGDDAYPNQTGLVQRFFPSVGNHDASPNGTGRDGGSGGIHPGYLDYFHTDPTDPAGRLPAGVHTPLEDYYDFQWGPVHVFVLDSNTAVVDEASLWRQQQWLRAGLMASEAPWQFVVFHHAAYSSASHGSNETMQWPLERWGADAVLNGHDHTFELSVQKGLPYLVNGLGGRARYSFEIPIPGSQFRYNADNGALRVTADSTTALFEFVSIDDGDNGANGGLVVGTLVLDRAADYYSFVARAGDGLTVLAFDPNDTGGPTTLGLDPVVELIDPLGRVVASDDNGGGGDAALLTHTAAMYGTYYARVSAAGGTKGQYIVRVLGATGGPAPSGGEILWPELNAPLNEPPSEVVVRFDQTVRADRIDPTGVSVGGVVAVSATLLDGHTVAFELGPGIVDGPLEVTVAAETISAVNTAGNNSIHGTATLDSAPPTVTGIAIGSTSWTSRTRQALVAAGDPQGMFPLSDGPAQLDPLPWTGLDQIRITFSEPVDVVAGDLRLLGVNLPQWAIADFVYDASLSLAIWTLAQPLRAELVLLSLAATVTDTSGNPLDGDWDNGADTWPTGDGVKETDDGLAFRLNVVPGDVNGDGAVTRADTIALVAALGSGLGDDRYRFSLDGNGDGRLTLADVRSSLSWLGSQLPVGQPAPADSAGKALAATDAVFARIGREAGGAIVAALPQETIWSTGIGRSWAAPARRLRLEVSSDLGARRLRANPKTFSNIGRGTRPDWTCGGGCPRL